MSPTVLRYKGYRLFFFSREETMHVHVWCADGESKFWIEPTVTLASQYGLSHKQLAELQKLIEERRDDIAAAWARYFGC